MHLSFQNLKIYMHFILPGYDEIDAIIYILLLSIGNKKKKHIFGMQMFTIRKKKALTMIIKYI